MTEPSPCPFCLAPGALRAPVEVFQDPLVRVLEDGFPVSPGHLLVVPRRHVADYFEASEAEVAALWAMVHRVRAYLNETRAPDGFNVGVNIGEAAGQTVGHLHVHVIPRYHGDMQDPRGGVRGVIPSRQKYSGEPSSNRE